VTVVALLMAIVGTELGNAAETVVFTCDRDMLVSQSQGSGVVPAPVIGSPCAQALADIGTTAPIRELKAVSSGPQQLTVTYTVVLGDAAPPSGPGESRMIVGSATFIGSPGSVGGYAAADQVCNAQFPGSAVCTVQEVFSTIRAGAPLNSGGVNTGITQELNQATNVADCVAWTNNVGVRTGFNATPSPRFVTVGCDASTISFSFACCD
jgi:hypothetical protein